MRRRTPTRDAAVANAIRAVGRENVRLEAERDQAWEALHAERSARLRDHTELTRAGDRLAAVARELRHAGIDTATLALPDAVRELARRASAAETQLAHGPGTMPMILTRRDLRVMGV